MADTRAPVYRSEILLQTARSIWPARLQEPYVQAAIAWVAFIAPDKAGGREPDPEQLARHTRLLGFDDRYYTGLLRLFTALRMGD